MTPLFNLWLPILLAGILVFVVSSVIHMGPLWHRGDYPKIPGQQQAMDALRPLAIPPGDYMVPRADSMEHFRSAAFKSLIERGPVMIVTVCPNGMMSMARSLGGWFVYCGAVGVLAAYVAGSGLPVGTRYLDVFRFVGVTAFVGYVLALWQMSIWYRRAWSATLKGTLDRLIYALLSAGVFGWLWPK